MPDAAQKKPEKRQGYDNRYMIKKLKIVLLSITLLITSLSINTHECNEVSESYEYILNQIKTEVLDYKNFITINNIKSDKSKKYKNIIAALDAVCNTEADTFWLRQWHTILHENNKLEITFSMAFNNNINKIKSEKEKLDKEIEKIINNFDPNKTNGATIEMKKFYYIRDYIIKNTEYAETDDKNNPKTDMIHDAYGCIINKYAVCDGFSKAIMLLSKKMGILSGIIYGSGNKNATKPDHAWNYIKIDDHYYWTDVTQDNVEYKSTGKDHHKFDMMTDNILCKTHIIFTDFKFNKHIPICNTDRKEYLLAAKRT